jgi:hypothetical protein
VSRPAISGLRRRVVDEALEAFGGRWLGDLVRAGSGAAELAWGVERLGCWLAGAAERGRQDPVSVGVGGVLCGELRREWLGMGGRVGGHRSGCGARASEAGGRGVGRAAGVGRDGRCEQLGGRKLAQACGAMRGKQVKARNGSSGVNLRKALAGFSRLASFSRSGSGFFWLGLF